MADPLLVIERKIDWKPFCPSENVVAVDDYLKSSPGGGLVNNGGARIINLCRSYRYLSKGYYCSLLAEARGDKVIPSVATLSDLGHKPIVTLDPKDLSPRLHNLLARNGNSEDDGASLLIYFGATTHPEFQEIARHIFDLFPCPILQAKFKNRQGWCLESVRPGAFNRLTSEQEDEFATALDNFSRKVWRKSRSKRKFRYEIAMLYHPEEEMPPSNRQALANFVKAARRLDIDMELITRKDYIRLNEYDGLFIRETTAVNHYTYMFARKAAREGMVVLDDPDSIVKCANKVYLSDLFKCNYVPSPQTMVLSRGDDTTFEKIGDQLGYPVILKIPDGSFSRGVFKAADFAELQAVAAALFLKSTLLIAQEFIRTDFDWRVGVLDRKPLFVCQYYMSKGHWQIINNHTLGKGSPATGRFKTFPVETAPPEVVRMAVKAANLIGGGFYGVDLKQNGDGLFVIEVNDNPNLDAGVEDAVLGLDLYRRVVEFFLMKLERRRIGLK